MDQTWVYFLKGYLLLVEKIKTYEKSDYKDIFLLISKFNSQTCSNKKVLKNSKKIYKTLEQACTASMLFLYLYKF
jgi:hypothetical protein